MSDQTSLDINAVSRASANDVVLARQPGRRVGEKSVYFDKPEGTESVGEQRVAELDSFRGLAALVIVMYHARSTLIPWGWASVDLFFVLSGYLITTIIIKHGTTKGFVLRFYTRRALRVWPIYYLLIGLIAAFATVLYSGCTWRGLPYVLTFTQNVSYYWSNKSTLFSLYLGHTWTLAIEEQFYLIWPALILLLGRKYVIPLSLVCLVGTVFVRARFNIICSLLGSRGDGLALGGLLAGLFAVVKPNGLHRRKLLAIFAAIAAVSAIVLHRTGAFVHPDVWKLIAAQPVVPILAFNCLWFAVVGIIVCQSGRRSMAFLRLKTLRNLGMISYGLYLFHHPLILMTNEAAAQTMHIWPHQFPLWFDLMRIVVCLNLGFLSWNLLERPILQLKEYFAYKPSVA